MSSRELIFLQPSGHADALLPKLHSAGWNVAMARNAEHAREMIESRNIRVGLAHLDDSVAARDEMLELWPVTVRQMEWVAMLDSSEMRSGRLSHLITDCFYDYHTLPADVDRLLFSLGHAYGMATMPHKAVAHKSGGLTLAGAREEAERVVILSALRRSNGNISRASHELDISRVTLYRLMRKHLIPD